MSQLVFCLDLLKGVIFYVLLFIGAFLSLIALLPAVLSLPIHSVLVIQIRKSYTNWITGIYLDFIVSLIALIGQTQICIYCDDPSIIYDPLSPNQDSISSKFNNATSSGPFNILSSTMLSNSFQLPAATLIMSNHSTRIDYMFSGWCYGMLTNRNSNMKLIVRDFFRSVPILGWGMQCMMYIFLNERKTSNKKLKDSDVYTIAQTFNYLLKLQIPTRYIFNFKTSTSRCMFRVKPYTYPLSVFVWPEGAFFNEQNKQRSNACKYNNI